METWGSCLRQETRLISQRPPQLIRHLQLMNNSNSSKVQHKIYSQSVHVYKSGLCPVLNRVTNFSCSFFTCKLCYKYLTHCVVWCVHIIFIRHRCVCVKCAHGTFLSLSIFEVVALYKLCVFFSSFSCS